LNQFVIDRKVGLVLRARSLMNQRVLAVRRALLTDLKIIKCLTTIYRQRRRRLDWKENNSRTRYHLIAVVSVKSRSGGTVLLTLSLAP